MLAIQPSKAHRGKCIPNILPCRINHNGPVDASKRYWNPTTTPDGKITAYFRGRKLHGRQVKIPKGYKGVVVSKTERIIPRKEEDKKEREVDEDEVEEEEDAPEAKILEEEATFDEVMLWGHETVPDGLADPYVKGVEEWIAFAGKIHGYEDGGSRLKG